MPKIQLLDGESLKPSGSIEIERRPDGAVRMCIEKPHAVVTFTLPPSIARSVSKLLAEVAGPDKPNLKVVE